LEGYYADIALGHLNRLLAEKSRLMQQNGMHYYRHSLPTIEEIEESDAEETGWQISKENIVVPLQRRQRNRKPLATIWIDENHELPISTQDCKCTESVQMDVSPSVSKWEILPDLPAPAADQESEPTGSGKASSIASTSCGKPKCSEDRSLHKQGRAMRDNKRKKPSQSKPIRL
jgi:hypothetical protein